MPFHNLYYVDLKIVFSTFKYCFYFRTNFRCERACVDTGFSMCLNFVRVQVG